MTLAAAQMPGLFRAIAPISGYQYDELASLKLRSDKDGADAGSTSLRGDAAGGGDG